MSGSVRSRIIKRTVNGSLFLDIRHPYHRAGLLEDAGVDEIAEGLVVEVVTGKFGVFFVLWISHILCGE